MKLRLLHRWLGVLVALPSLLWGLSGMLLAWKNWARDVQPSASAPRAPTAPQPFAVPVQAALLGSGRPEVSPLSVEWRHLAGQPYYVLHYPSPPRTLLIDGRSGRLQPGIEPAQARLLAVEAAPPGVEATACRVQREPSLLLFAGAELPLFRVALSDGSDVYISPTSGEVVMRGSRLLWAIRFAFYRLHVWKWSDAPGPHRSYWLLGLMAGLLVLSSGSGLIVALRLARRR